MFRRLESSTPGMAQAESASNRQLTNQLPQELWDKIFSFLGKVDLQATALASRGFNSRVLHSVNHAEPASIKKFTKALAQRLDQQTFPATRASLMMIGENVNFNHFGSLRLVEDYILNVKADLIQILKLLTPEVINDLKAHVESPHFMEDIFTLAAFENQIDAAMLIPDQLEREEALSDICQNLAIAGGIDRAIEISGTILFDSARNSAFSEISRILALAGNIDRAVETVKAISNDSLRLYALKNVSVQCPILYIVDQAIEIVMAISDESIRKSALIYIRDALLQEGCMDKVAELEKLLLRKT